MAPTTQSMKAAVSAAQARKAAVEAKTIAESMAYLAASIAERIENLQADAEELVFNKKILEI